MGAFSLCGTETTRDIEHCHLADQKSRARRHRVNAELVIFGDLRLHDVPFTA
jgi:hypothetical protein